MKKKLMNFVSQLSDDEIDGQLENIFEWARIYKDLLEEEKQRRRHCPINSSYIMQSNNIGYNSGYEEDTEEYDVEADFEPSEIIDYNLAQMINAKVALLSVEETEERLSILQSISLDNLNDNEKAQLLYEIEVHELHLYELVGRDENDFTCPSCGETLEEGAKFCGKCGYKI